MAAQRAFAFGKLPGCRGRLNDRIATGGIRLFLDDCSPESLGARLVSSFCLATPSWRARPATWPSREKKRSTAASVYDIRFQELDCFLTDERTMCGRSGSPAVRRRLDDGAFAPSWQWMIGMHCTRMSLCARDQTKDERGVDLRLVFRRAAGADPCRLIFRSARGTRAGQRQAPLPA